MLRTTRARPIDSASAANSARSGPETAHSSGASAARNAWRRSSTSSVASCCGPQPPASSALEADQHVGRVALADGEDHARELGPGGVGGARRHHLVERREGVTGRASAPAHRGLHRFLVHV